MTLINKIKAWFVQPEPEEIPTNQTPFFLQRKKGFENWVNRPKNNRKYTRGRKHSFINNRYYNYAG